MKITLPACSASILAIAAILFTPATSTHADTYKIYDLGSAHLTDLIGIDTSGDAVLYNLLSFTYQTYIDGVSAGTSNSLPGLAFDNGTPCTPTLSSPLATNDVLVAKCNAGREVYGTGDYAPAPYANQIFDGPDPATDLVTPGQLDILRLNASGDFAYIANINSPNTLDGEIYQAIDLTSAVPEPTSLFLLGTGLLAGLGAVRERWLRPRS